MGGRDHWLAMQHPAPGQRVEEEVDGVDMNDIGVGEVAEDLRRDRIAARALPGDAHHIDAGNRFLRGKQLVRLDKEAIQRDHACAIAERGQLPAQVRDNILQPALVGQELPDDMCDERLIIRHAGQGLRA